METTTFIRPTFVISAMPSGELQVQVKAASERPAPCHMLSRN